MLCGPAPAPPPAALRVPDGPYYDLRLDGLDYACQLKSIKQNKTKQNKTKQNKTKHVVLTEAERRGEAKCIDSTCCTYTRRELTMIGFSLVPQSAGGTIDASWSNAISPAAAASNSSFLLPHCCSLSVGIPRASENCLTFLALKTAGFMALLALHNARANILCKLLYEPCEIF